MVWIAERFKECSQPHVRTSDAQDDESVYLLSECFGGRLHPVEQTIFSIKKSLREVDESTID